MISVNVAKEKDYSLNTSKIEKSLSEYLKEKRPNEKIEASVSIVGEETMKKLGKRYLKEDGKKAHNVLSFTASETKEKFVNVPDGRIRLGEIVICFPVLKSEAKEEGKSIDEKAVELVLHGDLHLLGVHHDL